MRRSSDRLKVVIGLALMLALSVKCFGYAIGFPTDNATDLVFAAFGALIGILANMEEA